MLKRFVVAFVAFVGLIVPTTLLLAMLAAPATPAPLERPGTELLGGNRVRENITLEPYGVAIVAE